MRKPVAGEKVFIFQPETKSCKAHWVETSVTKTWLEGDDFMFETNDSVELFDGVDDNSLMLNEWSEEDEAYCWSFFKPDTNLSVQEKMFRAVFN